MVPVIREFVIILIGMIILPGLSCQKEEDVLFQKPFITVNLTNIPLYTDQTKISIANFNIQILEDQSTLILEKIALKLDGELDTDGISAAEIIYQGVENGVELNNTFSKTTSIKIENEFKGRLVLQKGTHRFQLILNIQSDIDLISHFDISEVVFHFDKGQQISVSPSSKYTFRPCLKIRKKGMDNCDTYRIPGLITTNKGTLIAVYDNRYNNSKDLQEDIDVGMSRSTDGGNTWESMKVILDMGLWGGKPQNLNGIGDPCVLYDHTTNTIWVAGLWMNGSATDKMLWWASNPGINPEETGQFILTKSEDDGITWSQPINITSQIKDPAWQLLLQGPGKGITLEDGTLVFPAQFKADIGTKSLDGGKFTCHSTIVYSQDHGQTWKIGEGAKSNTTEAQVVQLHDGSIMLNMRDDRNRTDKSETNGRAVSVSTDLGKTWVVHPTSNNSLPESNCMASLIHADLDINNVKKRALFFSNPANKQKRCDMTIKASLDGGLSWPETLQLKLNAETGYGYSCMTMVDKNTIGILYEGVKELYFQKISVKEIIKQ